MKNKGKIYALVDPFTDKIRYIGFTRDTIKNRFSCHKHDSLKRNCNTRKAKWFRKCNSMGKLPYITLLEDNIPEKLWKEKEDYYISQYSNLTNQREGGCGIIIHRDTSSIYRSTKPKMKAVVQLSLEGKYIQEFESIKDAERHLNLTSISRIRLVIKGKAFSSNGYRWALKEDYLNDNIPVSSSKEEGYLKRKNGRSIPIQVFDTFSNKDLGSFESTYHFLRSINYPNTKSSWISPTTNLFLKRYRIIKI